MTEQDLTKEQVNMMLHALGKSHTPQRELMGWRNYYCVNERDASWDELVEKGLAQRGSSVAPVYYAVSEAGLELLGVTLK